MDSNILGITLSICIYMDYFYGLHIQHSSSSSSSNSSGSGSSSINSFEGFDDDENLLLLLSSSSLSNCTIYIVNTLMCLEKKHGYQLFNCSIVKVKNKRIKSFNNNDNGQQQQQQILWNFEIINPKVFGWEKKFLFDYKEKNP
ncbi:hypothetical protein DERF_012483 [Dermatophagoides farinae]|uniref:Uncharacterized protein n=1 Tax=Dermatophagoides farinae TaxID=6954 RepID=A0A922L1S0_DERFA|nr:hypothetical protein DERF_012483 [Dermatophagoides farinae]